MSSKDVVIRVEGLGKKYTIKHEQQVRHNTLRDAVAHQASALGRWANPFTLAGQLSRARRHSDYLHDRGEEDFWALKDVSFEIRRGERMGIIGRNGAGKSTLLKILSRITEPTTGRVEIRGRVAALLEVGTGFHPELTGRENIYLNGAILGMTRREIRSKFDEIVDFAEVEKFLDTPVKRYSSGMYVRLAFAVAAHLEPEILVVDEVLAVGDASFQKKCLGKMESVVDTDGKTVIFVSHQMGSIKKLCSTAMLMNNGKLMGIYPAETAISEYFRLSLGKDRSFSKEAAVRFRRKGDTCIYFCQLTPDKTIYRVNDRLALELILDLKSFDHIGTAAFIEISFINGQGDNAMSVVSRWDGYSLNTGSITKITASIDRIALSPGDYSIYLLLSNGAETLECIPNACTITINEGLSISDIPLTPSTGCQFIESAKWTCN